VSTKKLMRPSESVTNGLLRARKSQRLPIVCPVSAPNVTVSPPVSVCAAPVIATSKYSQVRPPSFDHLKVFGEPTPSIMMQKSV